jgi:integrase
MPGRDTRTRFQGVFARHQEACRVSAGAEPKACECTPSYYGVVWDATARKHRKTRHFARIIEARNARNDLADALRHGGVLEASGPKLEDATMKFVASAKEGVALNKWGRRYRRRAVQDLESALRQVPDKLARRRLGDVRRGDLQELVDDMTRRGLSGSRVRSVVNALRSLYRWAQDRELVAHNPAELVRLPAMDATPRDRVATPAEFAGLLAPLPIEDALPYALAAYGAARHQEIRTLDWSHVDLKLGAVELAADEEGRKPGGSWRVVPLVKPLSAMLRRARIAQGRPTQGKVCPPKRDRGSGLLDVSYVQKRVHARWEKLGLEPIGLHEARHTAATWLDHAGVSPKVASQLMGHKTPEYQPGAAAITLRRYTHTLPGELERARDLLDAFLVERTTTRSGQA